MKGFMLAHPQYTLFMFVALAVFLAARQLLPRCAALARVPRRDRLLLAFAAFSGGVFGAKLPFMDTSDGWLAGIWFRDGKTLTTGLVGAYVAVELAKFALNIRVKTGDSFALPLALALAVGRLGCFFNGCCHGQPTTLPWAVDFGDGIPRHPTQIYESLFHLGMAFVLYVVVRTGALRDHRLKLYLIVYCAFRFVTEWLRPEAAGWMGLTFYQGVTAVFATALAVQWLCDALGAAPNRARGNQRPHTGTFPLLR